mmetsp:Transcript_9446/g.28181  ORF Transcript_9446/g.28181 Transcript_9446/m.28181 type:complete len:102 (+) Transcript_9446:2585-2890(+)
MDRWHQSRNQRRTRMDCIYAQLAGRAKECSGMRSMAYGNHSSSCSRSLDDGIQGCHHFLSFREIEFKVMIRYRGFVLRTELRNEIKKSLLFLEMIKNVQNL